MREAAARAREREGEEKEESIRFFLAPVQWITYKECAIKIQTYVLFRLFLSRRPASDMYIYQYIFILDERCCSISSNKKYISYQDNDLVKIGSRRACGINPRQDEGEKKG